MPMICIEVTDADITQGKHQCERANSGLDAGEDNPFAIAVGKLVGPHRVFLNLDTLDIKATEGGVIRIALDEEDLQRVEQWEATYEMEPFETTYQVPEGVIALMALTGR